jgi:hypothetical protein
MAFDLWSCPLSEVLHAQRSQRQRISSDRLEAMATARTCIAGNGPVRQLHGSEVLCVRRKNASDKGGQGSDDGS